MKQLNRSQSVRWCAGNGFELPETARDLCVHEFGMPEGEADRVVQSNALMNRMGARQCLLYFTEWGVWPSVDRWDLFNDFCKRHNCEADLSKFPGYKFQTHEFEQARELAAIGAESLWDLSVIGAKGKRLLYFSHDEIGGASFSHQL